MHGSGSECVWMSGHLDARCMAPEQASQAAVQVQHIPESLQSTTERERVATKEHKHTHDAVFLVISFELCSCAALFFTTKYGTTEQKPLSCSCSAHLPTQVHAPTQPGLGQAQHLSSHSSELVLEACQHQARSELHIDSCEIGNIRHSVGLHGCPEPCDAKYGK